jgi:iron(III) transport system substrate-binding protein
MSSQRAFRFSCFQVWRFRFSCLLSAALLVGAVACSRSPSTEREAGSTPADPADGGQVTLYSGRAESLIAPLLERFERDSGVDVEVRYAGTPELAATLLEEGRRTRADVFLSQDAAALGAVSRAGLLRPLDEALLSKVAPELRSDRGDWIGVSGRARVVVYGTGRITEAELPQDLEQVLEPRYRGRFGVAPTNASFQAHLAAFRAAAGAEALDRWLAGLVANEPRRYANNRAIVDAVIAGEIDWGLVNHYYLWGALRDRPDAPAKNFFMPSGDVSSFVNVAGVGLLSDDPAGLRLVEYLVGAEAQRYFAEETFEYPLAAGAAPAVDLPPLDTLPLARVDFAALAENLEPTLQAIERSGLLQ